MIVKIAFFASARDIAGADMLELHVDQDATVADVRTELAQRFPNIVDIMKRSTWAVDHQYVDLGHQLNDGAEIGLIPPVSGG